MGTEPQGPLLSAGDLEVRLDGADLRWVRWHGEEILRHVYVGVRAPDWSTVPASVEELEVRQDDDGFSVHCTVSHRALGVDYRWEGAVSGRVRDGAGVLTVTMRGRAVRTFRHNRTGLCLLHPPSVAGRDVVLTTPQGRREPAAFPLLVGPQVERGGVLQPLLGPLRGMTIAHGCGPVDVVLTGDDFEVEDQRNWTDASFKTYSTPLSRGFPHTMAAGAEVLQRLTLGLPAPAPGSAVRAAAPGRPRVLAPTDVRLGGVGLLSDEGASPTDDGSRAMLRAAGLHHLRVEARGAGAQQSVERGAQLARSLGVPVHLAMFLPPAPEAAAVEAAHALDRLGDVEVAAVLVFADAPPGPGSEVTPPHLLRIVREVVAARRPGTAVGGGTALNFCELNRHRPPVGLLDVATFPVVPQVHRSDDTTVVETHQVLGDVVATARSFLGDTPLVVGPVTLRAHRPGGDPAAEIDDRQGSDLAAAWLLGELSGLLGAGADAVTAFSTAGPHGVLTGRAPTPSLAVVAAVCALRGGAVAPVEGYDPLETAALAVVPAGAPAGCARLLLGDLTGRARPVPLPAGSMRVQAHGPMGWQPTAPDTARAVAVRPCGLVALDVRTTQ